MYTTPQDTITPTIKPRKSFTYIQPYGNRNNFQITWDENSEICGGVFYSKTNEALKETKLFQLHSSALLHFFSKKRPLPCLTYNRKLHSNFSSLHSKKHCLIVSQLNKIFVITRNSFIHKEDYTKGKNGKKISFVFSGLLGFFKIDKIYKINHSKLDLIAVVGYERKGSDTARFAVFDVSTRVRLIFFDLESFGIKGDHIKVECVDVGFVLFGVFDKNGNAFKLFRVDLLARKVEMVDEFKQKKFTRVSFLRFFFS